MPFAKVKNLGKITSGGIINNITQENMGYYCIAFTSGFIPGDAPPGATNAAMVIYNLVTPRISMEWIDLGFRKIRVKEGDTWRGWY